MIVAAVAPPLSDELIADLVERASRPDFDKLQRRLKATGWCARPVLLRGTICDQNGVRVWSTADELFEHDERATSQAASETAATPAKNSPPKSAQQ